MKFIETPNGDLIMAVNVVGISRIHKHYCESSDFDRFFNILGRKKLPVTEYLWEFDIEFIDSSWSTIGRETEESAVEARDAFVKLLNN